AEMSERLVRELRAVGYQHVTIDLQGYRLGSLDRGVTLLGVSYRTTSHVYTHHCHDISRGAPRVPCAVARGHRFNQLRAWAAALRCRATSAAPARVPGLHRVGKNGEGRAGRNRAVTGIASHGISVPGHLVTDRRCYRA